MITIAFISVCLLLIFNIGVANSKLRKLNEEKTQAMFYASQAVEAVKLLNWDNIGAGDYRLLAQGNNWGLAAGSELINNFYTRTINVSSAQRASTSNGQVYGPLVASGYTDPDTKKIVVTMDWISGGGIAKQEKLEAYLYHWQANRWIQTDWIGGANQADWSDPTRYFSKDAGIDDSIAGVVSLHSGFLDWSQATTTDTYDTAGNFDDNDVFELNGQAYLVTEDNPAGSEFYILNVNDVYNIQLLSSLNIGSGVTAVVVQNNYAYISTRGNSTELRVINISNPLSPAVVFSYNLPGNSDARDIVVSESELYIAQGDDLYAFSIANPASPVLLDSVDVDETANEVFVSEDNVYLATEEKDEELQIVDVTNPANLEIIGIYDLPGSLRATDVNVRGNRAYVSTRNSGSQAEFYVFDIADPTNPIFLGSYEAGENIYSFAIVGPYALLGTNLLNEELVVVDVSFPATITKVAGFDLNGRILGMSANCATIYAATTNNQSEFFIISTQVTDCVYASSGVLESSTLDTASASTTYNWISWGGSAPQNTSIRFQLATSNSISGPWSYLGPDATSGTYYTTAAKENINYDATKQQRYIRYKLFLNSNASLQAPILEEVTISYSAR